MEAAQFSESPFGCFLRLSFTMKLYQINIKGIAINKKKGIVPISMF